MLYDGDLNEVVSMLFEGCSVELDEYIFVEECFDVLRFFGIFLNNVLSKENYESIVLLGSFDKCYSREFKYKEIFENREYVINEEFNEMENNVFSS